MGNSHLIMHFFNDVIQQNQAASKKALQNDSNSFVSDWIQDYVQSNPWLLTVDEQYLNDNFNLYGLSNQVEEYNLVLKIIRGQYYDYNTSKSHQQIQKLCENLYSLIHGRYLLTFPGIREMQKKFQDGLFGECPRVACKGQKLLPIGLSPNYGEISVKVFCPCCSEVYECSSTLDGSAFGPYFPHFFIQALKDELNFPSINPTPLSFAGIAVDLNTFLPNKETLSDENNTSISNNQKP